jgi:hypothetical protein
MTLVFNAKTGAPLTHQLPLSKPIKYKDENNNRYEGIMGVNSRSGQGKITYKNRDVYEGSWIDDKKYGQGKITYKNGDVYEGSWIDDKKYGQGKMMYEDEDGDGDIYEGLWIDDKKTGQGKITYINGDIYEGLWIDDKKTGQGKFTYANGAIYEGSWVDDKKTGQCKFTYVNGDVYEGNLLAKKRYGKGKMVYKNGRIYDGEWKNDVFDGYGKFTCKKGAVYEGECSEGVASGHGKKTYENGDVYEGNWKNDKRSELGKMIYKNGDVHDGIWDNDVIKKRYIYNANKTKITYYEEEIQTSIQLIKMEENTYLQYRGQITVEIKLCIMVSTLEELFKLCDEQIVTVNNDLSQEEKEMTECPISLVTMNVPVITSCKHSFCRLNLDHYCRDDLCPLCRQIITYSVIDDNITNILKKMCFLIPSRNLELDYDGFKNLGDIKLILAKFKPNFAIHI